MAGDYTRFTFKSRKDYSSVLKEQGRVDLDADFNELIEIVDRRWRTETLDLIGDCVVPNTTPDAFLVVPIGLGDFTIGIGRMYVDGIQVENHGLPPDTYLADLGEQRGTLPVLYSDQPYLPAPLPPALAPPPLPAASVTSRRPESTDLVYIDVWQREVSVLGDPSLREIALGGPDTTTRIQTAWQVRVIQHTGDHGCGDSIAWDNFTAPSAGRLTTATVLPPASDDPCIISPNGGYRGLENRLYRVEIHATRPIGGATSAKFKWSRNNATIASTVNAIPSANSVTVEQVGRDQVLRFEIGNWIEITDDYREFQSLPGHTAQITAIDEANRILTFATPIPGTIVFNPADPSRHTRVTRWDQTQNVDANGLLDVVAGPVDIEDGIRINFTLDPATGNFSVGDYWVFAARTADGSVEVLQNAPPRGILHHFCRLGFIHWGADLAHTTFDDCRQHWPTADCDCCTVTVGDGIDSRGQFSDIQQAINALGSRGGIVCIGRGFYRVTAGLRLDATKRNVTIRGMGPATRIAFTPAEGDARVFLDIERTEHVRLEDLFIVASSADSLVRIVASRFCEIRDCSLVNLPLEGRQNATRSVEFTENSSHCEIIHCALLGSKAVSSAAGQVSDLVIRDSRTLCTQASVSLLEAQGIEILHNQFRGLPARAFPNGPGLTRETIDAFQAQVSATFQAAVVLSNFQSVGVLIYSGNRIVVSGNFITAHVAVLGFLFLNARIELNDIVALIGMVVIFGVLIKVGDNFVLGLFAGLIHAGMIAVLDCTSNEWVGIEGIVWMSLGELLSSFARLLATALATLDFARSGLATLQGVIYTGAGLTSKIQAFGLVAIGKVDRNTFYTFFRGIYKTDRVLSADISIIDNSFSLCSNAGIELGSGARFPDLLKVFLTPFISLRHLVQGNSLAVKGRGILSSTPFTFIEQNSVECPSVAIELDALSCAVKNNLLLGLGPEPPEFNIGLITLHNGALSLTISGNQLLRAPGHSILVFEDVSELTVDDNLIQGARYAGIGTHNDAITIRGASISRNRILQCQGDVPAGSLQFGGAVAIGDARDVRFFDNTITANSPATQKALLRWCAVFFGNIAGIEISGNAITDNATVRGLGGAIHAIGVQPVRGVIRVQNNVVQGNGGSALVVEEGPNPLGRPLVRALVQNNHFSDGPNPTYIFVDVSVGSVLFEGNQCFRIATNKVSAGDVSLVTNHGSVCSNSIETSGSMGMAIIGARLIVNGNSVQAVGGFGLHVRGEPLFHPNVVRVVVTSNLTTGIIATATGTGTAPGMLVRGNNIPAP
jgi:hypothetical protein